MGSKHRWFSLSLVLLCLAVVAFGQVNTASLSGTVTDPSGAGVATAALTLSSPDTGLTRTVASQTDGTYVFRAVPPGRYQLHVQAPGFAPAAGRELTLTVGEEAQMPIALKLGTVSSEVTVQGAPDVVETTRTDNSSTIGQQAIANLPSNGRSYINFTLLDSSTTRDNQPVLAPAPTSGLNFGGQRARANSVSIDGVEANDAATNGVRATLSQEAVQEFQILDSGYQAEHGGASAAVINIVSKQGTNRTRGDAFAYLRNRNFEARNALAGEPNPADTRLQSGFTLGGPLQPNRTFYFLSFENSQRHSTGFSQIGRDGFGLVKVPNPFGTTVGVPLPSGTYVATAGAVALLTPQQVAYIQQIAAVSPQAAASYYVLAGAASNLALTGSAAGNGMAVVNGNPNAFPLSGAPLPASFTPLLALVGNYPTSEASYFGSMRFDRQLDTNNSFFLRLSLQPGRQTGVPSNGENQATGLNAFSRTTSTMSHDFTAAGQVLSTLSATRLNELHFQVSRRSISVLPQSSGVAVELPGVASFGEEPFSPEVRTEKHYQFADNVSLGLGRHNLKFGVDYELIPVNARFPLNQGGVYFFPSSQQVKDPLFGALGKLWSATGAPDFNVAQTYGFGLPQAFVQQLGGAQRAAASFFENSLGLFVQDSFRVSSRLTLDYGLRYDREFPPAFGPANAQAAFAQNALGVTKGIPAGDKNFSPRLGLAWDPQGNGKQVFRANYGIFYGHPLLALAFLSDIVDGVTSPYIIAPHLAGADDLFQGAAFTPLGVVANPKLGYDPTQQRYNALSPAFTNQAFALGISPILPQTLPISKAFKFDYSEQAGVGWERQLTPETSFGLQYSYTHGVHLLRPHNINQGNALLLSLYAQALAGTGPLAPLVKALGAAAPLGRLIFNDFRPSGPNYPWAQNALGIPQTSLQALAAAFSLPTGPSGGLVPYSNVKQYESSGSSVYHGLTVTVNHRYSKGFQALLSYTYSHAIDDSTDLQTLQEPQDTQHPGLDRGNSNFDQRHRLVASGVYTLPGPQAGLAAKMLGNWTVAPIVELSAGRPFNIITNQDQTLVNNSSDARPSVVPLGTPGSFPSPDGKVGLTLPAPFHIGTLGRNVYRTPAYYSTDLRLSKHIPLLESRGLDFVVDAFNLWNHVNVREVDTTYTHAGRPVAAFDPRQFQFGLKLSF
ncbi:MAG: TonB-dependent receptor [Terriglobales bacterium]